MAKNEEKDDIRMDEFLSDDASNIAVEDFAIEADETGEFPENRRSVEILDYPDKTEENTGQQNIAQKGKDMVNKVFSSPTGRISVYVFLALNLVAIITPFIIERMEAQRRKKKWYNIFKF